MDKHLHSSKISAISWLLSLADKGIHQNLVAGSRWMTNSDKQ